MPTGPLRSTTPVIDIYVKLAQYPVLCDKIRMRMREELFNRGMMTAHTFEREVKQLAIQSQQREGLSEPTIQEDEETWQRRLDIVREFHTDALFAQKLGISSLEQIISEVLNSQSQFPAEANDILNFNPELAPWELLFEQGRIYDQLPPPEKEKVQHHLEEIKVVLIKRLLGDHLPYIAIAKKVFSIEDLNWVYERRVGRGKVGGKASGMLLAWRILEKHQLDKGPDIQDHVSIPETFFIGSETIYEVMFHNKLEKFVNQKYLSFDEMEDQYPEIIAAFLQAEFPDYILDQLRDLLRRLEGIPYVVRSSSLLEDHFYYSFSGKYESVFCANQGRKSDNLEEMINAILRVYASVFNPQAMKQRKETGLIDYDERMAIMIQPIIGQRYGQFFLSSITGTGLSYNPWHEETGTRAKDGCLRLTLGLGDISIITKYAQESHFVPLSHPRKRLPDSNGRSQIARPQEFIRVLNIETGQLIMQPIADLLQPGFPYFSLFTDDEDGRQPRLTFAGLTKDPHFIRLMRTTLSRLEKQYKQPIIIEFIIQIQDSPAGPQYNLYLLQCHTTK